jgi:transposase
MVSAEIRDRRRTLRYRNLVLKQIVQMKNRVSGLLMETGVSYNKQRLHKLGYFTELMSSNDEVSESLRPLLKLSRRRSFDHRSLTMPWSVRWNEIRCSASGWSG